MSSGEPFPIPKSEVVDNFGEVILLHSIRDKSGILQSYAYKHKRRWPLEFMDLDGSGMAGTMTEGGLYYPSQKVIMTVKWDI